MRLIDADALIIELQKDEALFDNEAVTARENSIKYTDNYAKIMWSRANGIRDAIIEAYDAPTIDAAEVVCGEWIISYIGSRKQTECSACGKSFTTYDVYGWNYCPWCGAKMKGVDDEVLRQL